MEAQRHSLENWKGRSRISKQGSYTQREMQVSQEGRRVWEVSERLFCQTPIPFLMLICGSRLPLLSLGETEIE